jgi:tetratricopeptide (TPR) repeat protein
MAVKFKASKSLLASISCILALTVNFPGNLALAGDPFRTSNPRQIGDDTEQAFEAIFAQGHYQEAQKYLGQAAKTNQDDPLVYALTASLAYVDRDWATLKSNAEKTLKTADKLLKDDPLRGNLYTGVGHFLEGAYIFETEGAFGAINKLQQVFKYLDQAEAVDSKDPELNLIKGYMDLLLAVNLPFSSPEQAIQRFQENAAPSYLVYRGIAVAYRDLKKYDLALEYIDKALQETPDNPEVQYLKAQFLRIKGRREEKLELLQQAIPYYDQALSKSAQLPKSILKPIERERRKTEEELTAAGISLN